MQIHELNSLGRTLASDDNFVIDTGSETCKVSYNDIFSIIVSNFINKSGDTMTGRLIVPDVRVNTIDGSYPQFNLYKDGAVMGYMGVHVNKYLVLCQYGDNTRYAELYHLPNPENNLTANKYYNLLTDKTPITITQGGTGAQNVNDAVTNLGLALSDFSSSVVYTLDAAHGIFVKQGRICYINYQSALLSTLSTPLVSGSTLFTLPSGYRPPEQYAAPFTVDALGFGNVTINTNGTVKINNITPNLTDGRIYLNCTYSI